MSSLTWQQDAVLQDGHEVREGGGVVQLLAEHLEHGRGALRVHVHGVEPN